MLVACANHRPVSRKNSVRSVMWSRVWAAMALYILSLARTQDADPVDPSNPSGISDGTQELAMQEDPQEIESSSHLHHIDERC
jgi:hypothetical protein